jgi:glycosyltransferase involved in cell wall biosynthesis
LIVRRWDESQRRSARAELGLPTAGRLLVSLGALTPRKRPTLLVASVASLLDTEDIHLAVAGAGPEAEPVRELAGRLGVGHRVHLMGHVLDTVGLLGSADALVTASTVEGVAQAVIQTLAAGRPVIATRAPGLHEIDGSGVFIADPSGDDLATTVRTALMASPTVVPPAALSPWRSENVDRSLARLHARLGTQR